MSENKRIIKTAIIGFGYMGRYHLEKIRRISDAEVVAACDVAQEKRRQAECEGLRFYALLEELLQEKDIELVVICTPNEHHAGIAKAALQKGKHVLCEKPAVLNTRELLEIQDAAGKAGCIFTVHHNRRWDDDYMAVKQIIQTGVIGCAVAIESRVLGERGVVYGWRADPACGGGMLYDWGPHLIDQILQIYSDNKVVGVFARLQSVLTPAVDDFAQINLFLDNNVCANLQIGTMALQKLPRWYIYGDRGTMKLDGFSNKEGGIARIKGEVKGFESVLGQKSQGPSRTMAPLEKENLEELALPDVEGDPLAYHRNLIQSVRGEAEPFVTPGQILRETKLIDAIFQSAKERRYLEVAI